jgi:hypothetical protein
MRSGWASLLAAAGATWAAPLAAQRVTELGLHALVAAADPALVVGGAYAALRPTRRLRLAITAAAGGSEAGFAARGELLGHFLLDPTARSGAGVYAGGGVAGVAGGPDEGYVVLLLGFESRPGSSAGWAAEVGVGGGVRVAVGYRWRRHPPGA